MADDIDRAQAHEQELRDDALAAHARRGSDFFPEDDGETLLCRVCDDFIPDARREALPGVQTCVPCQEEIELALRTGNTP